MSVFSGFLIFLSIIFVALALFSLAGVLQGQSGAGFIGDIGHAIAVLYLALSVFFLNFSITMIAFDNILKLRLLFKFMAILMYPVMIIIPVVLDLHLYEATFSVVVIITIFVFCLIVTTEAIASPEKYELYDIGLKWLLACLFFQALGAIAYFFIGRKQIKQANLKEIMENQQNNKTKPIFKDEHN